MHTASLADPDDDTLDSGTAFPDSPRRPRLRPKTMTPDQRKRLRRRLLRQVAADVAVIVANVETVEVDGNVHLPKPALVAALAHYFEAEANVKRHWFVDLSYGVL